MERVVRLFSKSSFAEKDTAYRFGGWIAFAIRSALLVAFAPVVLALGQTNEMPKRVTQPTPQKVVMEHMAAFNACDWKRLMAQYPDNVEFFSPGGVVVRGRKAVGEMFSKIVKPPAQGGVCGIKVTVEHTFVVDGVFNIQWRADAPFLAEPYRGADAYETKNGLMAAQVTTFDAQALKMKH